MKVMKIPQHDPTLRFIINSATMNEVVAVSDILYFEGNGNYTHVHLTNGRTFTSCSNLAYARQLLEKSGFLLINRSTLVNMKYITAFSFRNLCYVILSDGAKLSISRRRRSLVYHALCENMVEI